MNEDIIIDKPAGNLKEANAWKKNIAGIIDAAIIIAFVIGVTSLLPQNILDKLQRPIRIEFYILILLALYRLVLIIFLNEPVGMRICRIKFLNGSLQPLSLKEKILAAFFILTNGIGYYDRKH